jgi:hypothetical protein
LSDVRELTPALGELRGRSLASDAARAIDDPNRGRDPLSRLPRGCPGFLREEFGLTVYNETISESALAKIPGFLEQG